MDVLVGFMNWSGTFPWQAQSRPFPADTICTAAKAPGLAGVDALRREHVKGWGDYYAEGYVRVPDPRLQRLVDVANYHVRCDRTHWSFPVGIFPSHWNGRYFGFDEVYIHQGMISAGHLADARRCPDFRFRTLPDAERRVGHYGRNGGRDGAQWMWESVETGNTEGCPVGFWQQHYFHMAAICRTAWTQYLYEDDLAWLGFEPERPVRRQSEHESDYRQALTRQWFSLHLPGKADIEDRAARRPIALNAFRPLL